MIKLKKIILILLLISFLFSISYILTEFVFKESDSLRITLVSEIKEYNYVCESNATELFKDEFEILKENLESDSVNYDEYAKSIAKLFIIDFYTLDNKMTKNDIGGLQFIHNDAKEIFTSKAIDSVYKYLQSNVSNIRDQNLPIVSNIENIELQMLNFEYNDISTEAYNIILKWNYVEDLGYETETELIIVQEENKLFIVEKNKTQD